METKEKSQVQNSIIASIAFLEKWIVEIQQAIGVLKNIFDNYQTRNQSVNMDEHITDETKNPKTKPIISKPKKTRYTCSQKDVLAMLSDLPGPITPFILREKLLKEFNISVTEQVLRRLLTNMTNSETLDSPEPGLFQLPERGK